MRTLDYQNNILHFEGVDVLELAKTYKTPLYVYSENRITKRIKEVEESLLLKYPNTYAFYASKAFLNLEMARMIQDSLLGIDVASLGECFIALKGGIDPSNILYHGNNKSDEELIFILENNIGRVVVDNVYELERLALFTKKYSKSVDILIRFSPQLKKIHTHKNIQTGHKTSKFGFDLNTEQKNIIDILSKFDRVRFLGFHFHVGSQLQTNENHLEAIDEVFDYIQLFKEEYNITTKELNIGGGFGVYYTKNDSPLCLSSFIDPAMKKIESLSKKIHMDMPSVLIEPGRFIVAESAVTLYEVGSIKTRDHKNIMAINGGMTDNLRVALYDGKYEASLGLKREGECDTYNVVGNVCESTDVMIKDIQLSPVKEKDVLAVFSTGAYEQSLSNNFNKILRPAVVMIKDGVSRVIQRRETLEDLIVRDKK